VVSTVEGAELVFTLDDPDRHLAAVRLWQELGLPGERLDFSRVDGGWQLRLPRPSVHRVEYLFEITSADGSRTTEVDPTNPLRVDGAFGQRSVLELPGYTAPTWCDVEPVPGRVQPLAVSGTPLGTVDLQVWSPSDVDPAEPLPLLAAHDGPEMDAYAGLSHYVGAMIAGDELPRIRLALLAPGERNRWYGADLDYAAALAHRVLPAVREQYATTDDMVLMGASLGALAALHAEWSHPGTVAGLFLQSGSFFTPRTDPQERDFSGFGPVSAFVRRVLDAPSAPSAPVVAMTCGSAEENVHNNRVLAARLSELGWEVSYAESPDVHSFTSWRDTFDPHLTTLLQRVWS
jgi:enterochelin esterase-like enzyme